MSRDFAPSNYLSLGAPTSLNVAGQNFSVAFKIQRDGDFYVGSWFGGGQFQWLLSEASNGGLSFSINGAAAFLVGSSISTTGWHTVGVSYDDTGNIASIYIDGAVTDTDTTTTVGNTQGATEIGRAAQAVHSDCRFAEFGMWVGSVLSAAEHAAIHKGMNPLLVRPQTLKCYLPIWGTGSPERDYSGQGNHATIVGSLPAFAHAPVMPLMVPIGGVQHNPSTASIFTDADTIYLNLQALVTEEYPVVPFDLQASGTELRESTDSATVYLDIQALGGECHSTWSALNLGEGEPFLRWSGPSAIARWSGSEILRWSEGQIAVEGVQC